jgi:hypothetical protein
MFMDIHIKKFSFSQQFIQCVRLHSIRVISLVFIDISTNFIENGESTSWEKVEDDESAIFVDFL